MQDSMRVIKRDGQHAPVSFDKISTRLSKLCFDESIGPNLEAVDVTLVAQKTCASIHDLISTSAIDTLSAQVAVAMGTTHPEYETLAARIAVSNLHKMTESSCLATFSQLYEAHNMYDEPMHLLGETTWQLIQENHALFDSWINWPADYSYTYFGIKTMETVYLTKVSSKIVERPQHLLLRVALGIWGEKLDMVKQTYDLLSKKAYTHATPTLFNSGMAVPQLASCFDRGTMVATVNRGPVEIQDVRLGDLVKTHLGNIKPVTQVHINSRGDRSMFDVKVYKGPVMRVTGNHRLWAIPKQAATPSWVSVDDLEVGDYVGIPKNVSTEETQSTVDIKDYLHELAHQAKKKLKKIEIGESVVTTLTTWTHTNFGHEVTCSKKGATINRHWELNEDFCCLLGMFCGDGHIINCRGDISGVGFTIDHRNLREIEFIQQVGEKVYGIPPCTTGVQENTIQVQFHSRVIGLVMKELCGEGFAQKHIHTTLFSWTRHQVDAFLAGLITTDGCVSSVGVVSIQMTNVNFMRSLFYLARGVGVDCSYGKPHLQKGGTACHVIMTIPRSSVMLDKVFKTYKDDRIEAAKTFDSPLKGHVLWPRKVDDQLFLRLTQKDQVQEEDLPSEVYTLGVQDDHSYSVEGIIAENCFLLGIQKEQESVDGIYEVMKRMALISKRAGGIGLHIHDVRSKGALIRGTNGKSSGLIPLLKVINSTARYIDQAGKRAGAVACYLSPWHPDIFEFLEIRRSGGAEDDRARELFQALWIPDLFMKRVETKSKWSLFDPVRCPGLADLWGADFEALYNKYEEEGKYVRQIEAQELWFHILTSLQETSMPYILFSDSCNAKSNQTNLGTIRSSNLCSEVIQYSAPDEVATCNLASISLPYFLKPDGYDLDGLMEVAKLVTRNLNRVIDVTYYPLPEAKRSNRRHRPLGIGVQGLADIFSSLRLPFESAEAAALNKDIFEAIYFGAMTASMEIAKEDGPYETFPGSPASCGKFQFDLWGVQPSDKWDWNKLKQQVRTHGARNSLLLAVMPTASTSQILNNTEAVEPYSSNIFSRKTMAGNFVIVNHHLVQDLLKLGLWSKEMKDEIVANGGSVQAIATIPADIKALYKTSWEMSQKALIDMSIDRGAFICQSQSLNLFVTEPSFAKLSSMLFYGYKRGAKTLSYYLRSKPATAAIMFTVDPKKRQKSSVQQEPEACDVCSS